MLNVALWVHRIEAVLAMGHIFTVHFTVEHWQPGNFPFNAGMFDGTMPLEEARKRPCSLGGPPGGEVDWMQPLLRRHRFRCGFSASSSAISIILLGNLPAVFAVTNAALLTLFDKLRYFSNASLTGFRIPGLRGRWRAQNQWIS